MSNQKFPPRVFIDPTDFTEVNGQVNQSVAAYKSVLELSDVEYLFTEEHEALLDRERDRNRKLVEALNKISIPDPVGYDGALAWKFKEIARLALQENKK